MVLILTYLNAKQPHNLCFAVVVKCDHEITKELPERVGRTAGEYSLPAVHLLRPTQRPDQGRTSSLPTKCRRDPALPDRATPFFL